MRVLTVGNMYPPHHFGGYELVWQGAVEHLRARGHEVRVLTTDLATGATAPDDPGVHRELRWHWRDGAFARLGPLARIRLVGHNHRVLARHLEQLRPDVVAWWSMGGLSLSLLDAVRRRGIPAVAFVHDDWLAYGPRVDPSLRRADLGAAASYMFVSESTRRRALGLGLDLRETSVAHSGVHPDFLDPAPVRPWAWRLLVVGRLDPRKGADTAVAALAELPAEARLRVVGGGDEGEARRLRALAERLGVAERVELAGQRERAELVAAYGDADAVLFPVRWDEPWGLVPLEAMGRGRPVVATARGGSAEYLRDGENCLVFEAGDATALAAAVRRLADDAALRARLRAGGRATAARHGADRFAAAVERALLAHARR